MDTNSFLSKQSLKILVFSLICLLAFLWFLNYVFYNNQTGKRSKAQSVPTFTIGFSPVAVQAPIGQSFTETIHTIPPSDMSLRGYEMRVTFDKTKVHVTNITYKLGVVSAGLGDDSSTLTTVNQNGVIKIQGELQSPTGQVVTMATGADVADIVFTSDSTSSYSISIDPATAKFYQIATDGGLTPVPGAPVPGTTASVSVNSSISPTTGPTATTVPTSPPGSTNTPVPTDTRPVPTNTPAPTLTNSITLNLKLKFQGILSKVQPDQNFSGMNVRLRMIKKSTGDLVEESVPSFTVDDAGVWSATAPFSYTAAGGDYALLIKGPKHVQKKICDNAATETFPGTYRCSNNSMTFTAGVNDLDLTNVLMLSGDLPEQDGIVNAYDISLVRNNVGSTDPATVGLCDINLDGKCDTQDYSLVIAALSISADEQ